MDLRRTLEISPPTPPLSSEAWFTAIGRLSRDRDVAFFEDIFNVFDAVGGCFVAVPEGDPGCIA